MSEFLQLKCWWNKRCVFQSQAASQAGTSRAKGPGLPGELKSKIRGHFSQNSNCLCQGRTNNAQLFWFRCVLPSSKLASSRASTWTRWCVCKSGTRESTPASKNPPTVPTTTKYVPKNRIAWQSLSLLTHLTFVPWTVRNRVNYWKAIKSQTIPFQYFVFDFHMAPAMLFDKIITLTVRLNSFCFCQLCTYVLLNVNDWNANRRRLKRKIRKEFARAMTAWYSPPSRHRFGVSFHFALNNQIIEQR